jgi:hypothetical protein
LNKEEALNKYKDRRTEQEAEEEEEDDLTGQYSAV